MPIGVASIAEPHPGIDADWLVLAPGWVLVPLLVLAGSAAAAAVALAAGRRQVPQRRSAIAAALAGGNFPCRWWSGPGSRSSPAAAGPPCRSGPPWSARSPACWACWPPSPSPPGSPTRPANPERFGQTWQLNTFLGFNGQDFGPASRVLRAVAADRDVTGVDDARIGGAQSGQVSIESFTYAPVGGKRLAVVLTAGRMPARRTRSCSPRRPPRTCTPGRAPWSGSPAARTAASRCGSPASASSPRGRTTGTPTAPGSLPAGYDRIFAGANYAFKFHVATVSLRPGADVQAVARRLNAAAAAIPGGRVFTFTPPGPLPEIQVIKDLELLPLALSAFLALLAIGAVGHALSIAVHRRRHDLAVLRALGMTRLQTRMVVTTQASLLAVIGLVFGVPLGIALGRVIWRAVAGFTPLAYHPPLAVLALLLIGPVALLAANALAAWPQHRAARLRTGQVLRTE